MTLVLPEFATPADEIDFGAFATFPETDLDREAMFSKLRRERPLSFHSEPGFDVMPSGPGYWSLVKYDDVTFASRNPDLFISGQGSNIPDMPAEVNELFGSMINMDAPRHTKLRLIVNRGFTPRMINQLEDYVSGLAAKIVDDVAPKGEIDFVDEVAARLPLDIICQMMGIPEEDERMIVERTNIILGGGDPEYGGTIQASFQAGWELWEYAQKLGEDRLADPRDDITSALMQAEVEGERLTAAEFGSFFVLLVVAGNETTRNAISHGLLELTRHPDQRTILLDDLPGTIDTAVEEIVRWATPVIHFRRTATQDVVLRGQTIKAGEKVVLWYNSANRDEEYWDDPFRFDIRRTPNEHIGFGAGGPHFCLGANLARREIKVMLTELFRRLPDIEATGEPQMLQSPFIHGIKHLRASFSPA
ncbi:MAG TPA: cytochrome P450 [Acidimicrobiales bacterium]|jgi:cytochrome P450|nr:cytochrome P450 [Acidimicrobiales bacterium]